jgi:hypothetical protein
MKRRTFAMSAGLLLARPVILGTAWANDQDDAELIATTFVTKLTDGQLAQIYTDLTSAHFRATVPPQQFEQNIGVLRIQLGGAPRFKPTVEGSQQLHQLQTGQTGDFYYVRCRATYPQGPLFWDIWLERTAGRWAVSGFFYIPAPPPK